MIKNDTIEIFTQTECVLIKSIALIQEVLNDTSNSKFKMLLINSMENLKERREMLQEKLQKAQSPNEVQPVKTSTSTAQEAPLLPSSALSDREIANILFDNCNESVKKIYTYLNHYKDIDEKVQKAIKEAVKAIERLREHLAEYL